MARDEWNEFFMETLNEVREAGFQDLSDVAGRLEQVLDEVGDQLPERQADALQLAADILNSLHDMLEGVSP
ncbi:MAG TPA: hypothetical protein VIN09_14420 [Chloroflexota bacterium]|jgi:hypothetical protein